MFHWTNVDHILTKVEAEGEWLLNKLPGLQYVRDTRLGTKEHGGYGWGDSGKDVEPQGVVSEGEV